MLSLEIRLLTGRYAATAYNNRTEGEWPPHPQRIYSALVAAMHEVPDQRPAERHALEWLAGAGAPEVIASGASPRMQREVYVPTNDLSALKSIDSHIAKLEEALEAFESSGGSQRSAAEKRVAKAQADLVEQSKKTAAAGGKLPRKPQPIAALAPSRQPRTFPVFVPEDDTIHVCWPDAPNSKFVGALDDIAARAVRLGHSSSLVSMRFSTTAPEEEGRTRWVPHESGELALRVVTVGQLERLEEAHGRHQQIEPRKLPTSFARYANATELQEATLAPSSVMSTDDWLIFEVVSAPAGGRRRLLDASLSVRVCRALRGTLIAAFDGDWPEVLSGHTEAGAPSEQPHLAFVALPDAGHPYASGSILGAALVPPAGLDLPARAELLRAVGQAEAQALDSGEPAPLRLTLGRSGTLHLRRVRDLHHTRTLRSSRWTRASRRWATVTPVALGRNPGNLLSRDPEVAARAVERAEAQVTADCLHVGLPEPVATWVHPRSLHTGAPAARRFTPFPENGHGPRRVCVHAEILFAEPVTGPIVLGAGRYFGLGLCAPMDDR